MMKKIFLKIFMMILAIAAVLFWLLNTHSGLKSIVWLVEKTYPGEMHAGNIQGTLSDSIEMDDFTYVNKPKNISLQAKKIYLQNDLKALFNNTIHIPKFTVSDAVLSYGASGASGASKSTIYIDTLSGKVNFETPYRNEIISVDELSGHYQGQALSGTMHAVVNGESVAELLAELQLGNSHLSISPDNLKVNTYLFNLIYHPNENFNVKAAGMLNLQNLKNVIGVLSEASISGNYLDTWDLSAPVYFTVSEQNLTLEPLRFQNSKKAELLLQATWNKLKGGKLKLDVPEFAIHSPEINTKVSLELSLEQGKGQNWLGNGALSIAPGSARISLPGNKYYQSRFAGGTLKAILDAKGLRLGMRFKETPRNTLEAHVSVPGFSFNKRFKDQEIEGTVTSRLQDLSIAYLLIPPISRLKAILDISGDITGTVAKPVLAINANIHDAIFSIPKQHITVKSFSARLKGDIPGKLDLQSVATLGGNPVTIAGSFEPLNPEGRNSFDIAGDKIRVSNTDDMMIIASPKLHFEILGKDLFVTGKINVPEANITMKEGLQHVIVSKDVVFHGPLSSQEETGFNLIPMVDLNIEDEDKVHFKGFGLDAIIRGNITIEKRPDGLFTSTGRLTIVEGKYRLQGAPYLIHRGHLLYPPGTLLKDPILDIRIAKKRAEVGEAQEVGIYVQGSLQSPSFNLYSTDNLQSNEILSRLGFGGSHEEGEDSNKQVLSQTAIYLAGGANPIIESLQSKLGLEEFGVQSAESQRVLTSYSGYDTVLVAGKSLSKRIYLQFIQGMLEPLSILRLKYFLSPKLVFSVETSNAEDIGGDISFSLEHN